MNEMERDEGEGGKRERERETERGWVSIRVPERSSQIRAEGVTY